VTDRAGYEQPRYNWDPVIADVRQAGDGALYVVSDENNGELWKLVPRR
jgi:glucose/arabinose dehydrogenase